jgi:hypothetical protein
MHTVCSRGSVPNGARAARHLCTTHAPSQTKHPTIASCSQVVANRGCSLISAKLWCCSGTAKQLRHSTVCTGTGVHCCQLVHALNFQADAVTVRTVTQSNPSEPPEVEGCRAIGIGCVHALTASYEVEHSCLVDARHGILILGQYLQRPSC